MTSMPCLTPPATGPVGGSDGGIDAEVILGVDTHADVHVAAVVGDLGQLLDSRSFPTTIAGYQQLSAWARSHGVLRRAGIECTGSYGAALMRHLHGEGVHVVEVNQPDKATRRKRGKTDAIDAEAAALAVVSGRARAQAKTADGPVEALRMLRMARNSAVNASTKAINQLKAVLVTATPALRESLIGLGPATLLGVCANLPDPGPQADVVERSVVTTLRLLAARIRSLKAEAYELHKQMRDLVTEQVPDLLERQGVGPDSAAALLIAAGDNPHRMRGKPLTRRCAGSARSRHHRARPVAAGSTVAVTAKPT